MTNIGPSWTIAHRSATASTRSPCPAGEAVSQCGTGTGTESGGLALPPGRPACCAAKDVGRLKVLPGPPVARQSTAGGRADD